MRYADLKLDVEAAFRDLNHPNPEVRVKAADALGNVNESQKQRACQALHRLLKDEHSDIRYTAALSLGELKDQSSVDTLIEQMEGDGHPLPRQGAAIALGMIGDIKATAALIKALQSASPDVRFQATTSLMQVNPREAPIHLRKSLRDSDAEVRASAITALSEMGDTGQIKLIAPLLDDESELVRFEASMALARLGDRRGTSELLKHLDDKERQHLAAEHLFLCPDPEVAPILRNILSRWLSPTALKVWAAGILCKLGDDDGRRKLVGYLGSRREMVKGLCIQLLGEIGEPWATQALYDLVKTEAGKKWADEIEEALTVARKEK